MKHLSEKAVQYMRVTWGFDDGDVVDDMAMFFSHAEYELVAKRLVDSGAVEGNCPEARELIRVAKSISSAEEREIIDACLEDHTVLECSECNGVHFIPPWCDPNDWVDGECGYCGKSGAISKSKR
jgi:hypothetical protein